MAARHDVAELIEDLAGFFEKAAEPGVVSVYLYGSYAEGRAHRESDVDVGVLLDWQVHTSRKARLLQRVWLTSEVMGALRENAVDLVVLNDVPPGLGRSVVTRGIRVFCTAPELDHAYVRDVQLRAADLDPWLRRMRGTLLETIRG